MKLISAVLLFLSFVAYGQDVTMAYAAIVTPSAGCPDVEDDLQAYTTGTIHNQGNWQVIHNSVLITDVGGDKRVVGGTVDQQCAAIYSGSWSDDQEAEWIFDASAASYGYGDGPVVRGSAGGTYYCVWASTSASFLRRVVSGSATNLAEGGGYAVGVKIKLRVVGTTLYVYKDGELDTSIDGDGMVTDATIESGAPGVSTYGNLTTISVDEFKACSL